MTGRLDDREITAVAPQRPPLFSGRIRYAALGSVGVVAVGLMGFGVYSATHDDGPPTKPIDTGSVSISQTVSNPPEMVETKPPPPATQTVQVDPMPSAVPFRAPPPQYVILPTSSGGSFDVPAATKPDREAEKASAAAQATARDDATTHVAFAPTVMTGGKAGQAMHLTYVMMPQTISCALDTAMDSTLAGPILCHTTKDVLSPTHVLLLPTGTTVVGSYKNDVRNGQHRLFAFSGNAITQEGIPVPLNSPIGDGLGRTGVEGDYDGHIPEKFGAAIALTATQAAITLGQAALTKGNQSNTNFNFSGGSSGSVEGLAMEILRQQGSIPPTISVPPGAIVSIIIDHPIDFSEAMHVEARR